MKGLSGEVHLHLLGDDGIEMQRFLIFLAPLGIVFTVLPVRIELQLPVPAELGIPVPEHHQGHILLGGHLLVYGFIVGHLAAGPHSGRWPPHQRPLGTAICILCKSILYHKIIYLMIFMFANYKLFFYNI